MRSLLISFLFLCGCNQLMIDPSVTIDKSLVPYVNHFVSESEAVGRPVIITNLAMHFVKDLDGDTLGECYNHTTTTPLILISELKWEYQTEVSKTIIVFHEMGHCVLNRGHIETWTNGIMTSIMFPDIMDDYIYLNNWAYYMHELFTRTLQ